MVRHLLLVLSTLRWFFLETALSCACLDLLEPRSMIMTLVNGGAHLDFRTRHGGFTPLHKSAIHSRKESIIVSRNLRRFQKKTFAHEICRLFWNLALHRMSVMRRV